MFKFQMQNELFCKATGSGTFFAKKGAMVAEQSNNGGHFQYTKRLLGTNKGNVVSQVVNHVGRKLTGENLEVMEVTGSGDCYLADQNAHISVIELEPNGNWNSISVESEDLLAFTQECHYGVSVVGSGVLSQRGLFTSKLTYNGNGAQVVIKTQGNPLILQAPCRVDPDAVVAWTGKNPAVKQTVFGGGIRNILKTVVGQTSGESYVYEFNDPGQVVIVQPYERESGIKLCIDDDRYKPEMQSSAFGNSMENLGGLGGGLGAIAGSVLGGGNNNPMNTQGPIGSQSNVGKNVGNNQGIAGTINSLFK